MSNPLSDLPIGSVSITPSDYVDIDKKYTEVFIESAGNLSIMFKDGTSHIYTGLPKHSRVRGRIKRVMATGTTVAAGDVYLFKYDIGNLS